MNMRHFITLDPGIRQKQVKYNRPPLPVARGSISSMLSGSGLGLLSCFLIIRPPSSSVDDLSVR